jgi:hypothetical protein
VNLPQSAAKSREVTQYKRALTLFVGFLFAFIGLGRLTIPNLMGIFRIVAGCCLALGFLVYNGAFFVGAWDRGPVGNLQKTARGNFWLRIVAVVLWLAVVPVRFLWLYDYLHRHRAWAGTQVSDVVVNRAFGCIFGRPRSEEHFAYAAFCNSTTDSRR